MFDDNCPSLLRAQAGKVWFRLTQQTKDPLRNIAPRVAGIVSAEKNQDRNFVTIEKEIEECLEALTDEKAQANAAPSV